MSLNVVASPAITLVSGKSADPSAKKKEVATGDILNGVKGRVDEDGNLIVDDTIGKEAGGNTKTPPRFTGTEFSRQRTQDQGVTNGLFDKNTGVAGGGIVGAGALVDRSSTALGDISPGPVGDGRGVQGFAEEKGLLPSLLAAQFQSSFGGPGGGFGGGGGPQMPPINFGDMGLGGSNKKKGNDEIAQAPPIRRRTPTRDQADTPAELDSLGKIAQNKANKPFVDKATEWYGTKGNKTTLDGNEKLSQRYSTIGKEDQDKIKTPFETLKDELGKANNDNDRQNAINTFREALKQQDIEPEAVLRKLFGVEEDVELPTPQRDKA